MSRGDEREKEPVTITDRRRIDPETGAAREPAPSAPAPGVQPSPDHEPEAAEQVQPHDAEPSLEEEAALLEGTVQEGTVQDGPVPDGAGAGVAEGAADELDPVQAELAERTADLQRVSAEYANYRRRVDRDRQSVVEAAKASVVGEMLGVLDDLERARSHGDLEGPLRSVADKLGAALTGQGLSAFGEVGDDFDPAVHEAVQHTGDGGAPRVSIVMRQGYRFGERVLRPAMVAVDEDGPDEDGPADGGAAGGGAADGAATVPGPGGEPGRAATTDTGQDQQ